MYDDTPGGSGLSRRRVLAGAGGVTALALAGCSGPSTGGEATGGTLTYGQPESFVTLDPVVLNDVPSGQIAGQIFEGPYEYDTTLDLVPLLAAEAPTVERSGQRWIVPLDPDATFQNGDPVTAEDVAYSYTAPLAEGTRNAGEVAMIEDATPVDERTVQFDLAFQFGAFDHYLTRSVVPKAVRDPDREGFAAEPVGSGPFQLERATQGEEAVLTRWDDYWGEPRPALDGITFVPVPEGTTRVTTLETGETDVIESVPPNSWETVRTMDDARLESVLGVNYVYLAFNCNEGPTADPQVREAIDYAFSMDRAVSRFVEPTGERVSSPIPPGLADAWDFPTEEWASVGHERDIDRATSLLDDADSVPDDWEATIIVPPDEKRENVAVSVANGIREAGYGARVQRLDLGTFAERYTTGSADDYTLYALGWSGVPDPDTFLYFLFAHDAIGSTNGTYYRNEAMNDAILAARQATDQERRRQRYEDVVRTVLDDRVHLPAYTQANSFGVSSRVQDWLPHPVSGFDVVSSENNVTLQ